MTLGLPQLIHDADVDVDYPIDCELDGVEATEISFPLPGETTGIMPFLALVGLSRILADVLEKLYTTTSRRRGPEKIKRLHNDLINWRQRFESHFSKPYDSQSGISITRTLLSVLDQLTIIWIHLPGLTFENTTPEFQTSLDECTAASSSLIEILISVPNLHILSNIPIGPNIVLQCGLVHIFYQLNHMNRAGQAPLTSPKNSKAMLGQAINVLSRYTNLSLGQSSEVQSYSQPFLVAVSEASQLLQSLRQDVIEKDPVAMDVSSDTSNAQLFSANPSSDNTWFQQMPLLSGVDGEFGSLEDLNNLDYMEWIMDRSFGVPFSIDQDALAY